MKRISLIVGGKRYTIGLEAPYAENMEKELAEQFEMGKDNDVKVLLQAYLGKQLELLELQKKIEVLNLKLSL